MKSINRIVVGVLLGIMSLCCLGLGMKIAILQVNDTTKNIAQIKKLPELNATTFQQTPVNKTVGLTGILTGPNGETQSNGLVIYERKEWDVSVSTSHTGSGRNRRTTREIEGNWDYLGTVMINCALAVPGGNIPLKSTNAMRLEEPLHEIEEYTATSGESDEGIVDGTIRQEGFRAGDNITVIGVKTADGVQPKQIFGGTRAEYISYLEGQINYYRVTGGMLIVFGTILLIVAGLTIFL